MSYGGSYAVGIQYAVKTVGTVKEMDFLYILFFSATTPTFANVYIFEVQLKSLETPLKHYNFSQKHFQILFRTKLLLYTVNKNN